MTSAEIAALVGTAVQQGIALYKQLAATDSNIPPIETLLGSADINWTNVVTTGKAESTTTTVTTTK
jgi:hypothetical protein